MAKQKNPIESQLPEGAESFQPTDDDKTVQSSEPQPQVIPPTEKGKEKPGGPQPDSFVLGVLQSFPAHGSLYVDRHGGAYTPGTPTSIRGDALLYTNPFFKSKNQ